MESVGVFPDGEWGSFGAIFNSDELESPENYDPGLNSSPPACIGSWFYPLDALYTDFNLTKQDYSYSSSFTPQPNDIAMFIDLGLTGERKTGSFPPFLTDILEDHHHHHHHHHQALCINGDLSGDGSLDYNPSTEEERPKRKFNGGVKTDNVKKKTQHVQKSGRTVDSSKLMSKSKKNCSETSVEEDGNGGYEGQSSSSCSTDEDNASQEINGGSNSELNGKTRAGRGPATDPHSLYARKRRERINERLRILQKLVPNGTKLDISTMLEEAVNYVKFLQLQIKLLSSDDHWMYAPIAYNGMDIGLNQKISSLKFH